MEAFKKGTTLIYNGVTVIVTKVSQSGSLEEPDWYHIPVTVEWRTDVDV